MLTMLRKAWFIWPMVSEDVIGAVPLQPAPAMFWLDAHILRASSSTVWACTSKRPAIDRISCGSVIKRVGISHSPCREVIELVESDDGSQAGGIASLVIRRTPV